MNMFRCAVVLLGFGFLAAGQNWIEERTVVAKGTPVPRIDGLLTQPLTGKWGTFEWFQVSQGYSQAYAGTTYSPVTWMQLALGAGLEEDSHPFRLGSYIWAGKGKASTLAVFEQGGSGFWWKLESNYQIGRSLGIGQLYEQGGSSGPKIEYCLHGCRAKVWLVPFLSGGRVGLLAAVRWNLK